MRVWIDPQHDGVGNPGLEYGGLVERELVLEVGREFALVLRAFGWETRLSREDQADLAYDRRADAAQAWHADLAVLLHVNGSFWLDGPHKGEPRPDDDGLIAFAMPTDPIGLAAGSAMMRAAPAGLLRRKTACLPTSPWDWTKDAHYCLRFYAARGVPAVLVELGFATSPRDRAALTERGQRPALWACVAAGVATLGA